jgi:hypothetical protein
VNQNRITFRFQRALARALVSGDPVTAVRRVARDRRHPPNVRRELHRASADGIQMTALLVARLRFERLLRGSPDAERWFDADVAGFAAAFRRYHHEVPATAFFPPEEARSFRVFFERIRA